MLRSALLRTIVEHVGVIVVRALAHLDAADALIKLRISHKLARTAHYLAAGILAAPVTRIHLVCTGSG
jgi:hypothetical protein